MRETILARRREWAGHRLGGRLCAAAQGGLRGGDLSNQLGAALGIAAFGAISTAVYRAEIAVPTAMSGDVERQAHESLSGATSAAGQLPSETAEQLLRAARSAFTSGLNLGAAIGGSCS